MDDNKKLLVLSNLLTISYIPVLVLVYSFSGLVTKMTGIENIDAWAILISFILYFVIFMFLVATNTTNSVNRNYNDINN